jgi:O-methyltransferase
VILKKIKARLKKFIDELNYSDLHRKYANYTMIPKRTFIGNLALKKEMSWVEGCVVECGVWRGGMSAAMAEVLGKKRKYYLFDSFEGLPQAKEIDGQAALNWQQDTSSSIYYNNCKAEIEFAKECMNIAGVPHYELVKGWFASTLPLFHEEEKIALLRLDGDWYDSTMDCLKYLYPKVAKGGIIVIDDYYAWDGCCRAVHDYLSQNNLPERIRENNYGVCYIVKN